MKARHYQSADSAIRRIADRGKPGVARDIRNALGHLGETLDVGKATTLLRAGRWRELPSAVNLDHFAEIMRRPASRLADVHDEAAALGVKKINGAFAQRRAPVLFRKNVSRVFNYDRLNAKTAAKVREYQDTLISAVEDGARDVIEAAVTLAIAQDLDPEEIAGFIRDVIGLTSAQAQAVMNYRTMLEGLDPAVLRRRLIPVLDAQEIAAAVSSGVDLAGSVIDGMVDRYESAFLDYRAASIADTETTRAANMGLQDVYEQAVDRGALPAEAITRHWQIAMDERTCPVCRSIPELNPKGVGIDEPFDSDDGPQDQPPVHPNCRCSLEYVTDLDLVAAAGDLEDA